MSATSSLLRVWRAVMAMVVSFALISCSTATQHRVAPVTPEHAQAQAPSDQPVAQARAKAEVQTVRRKWTWKPYTAIALVVAGVAASSMIWVGFLKANRPLGMTGIGLSLAIPIGGSLPFLLSQDTPWTRETRSEWTPAKGEKIDVMVVDAQLQPVLQQAYEVPQDGEVVVDLQQALCANQQWQAGQALEVTWTLREEKAESVVLTSALHGKLLCPSAGAATHGGQTP